MISFGAIFSQLNLIYMKKVYSLIMAVALSSMAFSQSYDLEVSLVSPASGSTQAASAAVPVEFTITNNGPTTIPSGDTLFIGYSKGVTQPFSLTNVANQASGVILQADLATGNSLSTGSNDFDLSSCVNGDTIIVICYGAGLLSLSAVGDTNDTNLANDLDFFFIGASSGLEELSASITAYPNPVVDVLNIEASEPVNNITVTGVDGRVVLREEETNTINVSNLPAGKYIYRITTVSGLIHTDTFIKQ